MRSRLLILVGLVGCANDPQYVAAPSKLVAAADAMGNVQPVIGSLSLPIKPESMKDAQTRMTLAAKLGVMVPYVKVGDLEIEVDWTITNQDTANPGTVKIALNGANEYFYYDPNLVNYTPPNAENPLISPSLDGDIPIDVPAGGVVTGLFREDELLEASIDLDMVTRGNFNPFTVTQTVNKNRPDFQPMSTPNPAMMTTPTPMGTDIPRAAFAEMVCFQVVFKPDRAMTLEWDVRVRDLRGTLVDPQGLNPDGTVNSRDHTFAPAAYTVGKAFGPAQSPCIPM